MNAFIRMVSSGRNTIDIIGLMKKQQRSTSQDGNDGNTLPPDNQTEIPEEKDVS